MYDSTFNLVTMVSQHCRGMHMYTHKPGPSSFLYNVCVYPLLYRFDMHIAVLYMYLCLPYPRMHGVGTHACFL